MEENKNIQPLAAAEEPSFTSPYDGATEVSILQHAEKLKNQTTKEDGDTVQVYDVNGNPCKIEKSVLLEQTSKALPSVNDIKYLLALDASGNKLGLIPTEKLAEVLGKQLGIKYTHGSADITVDKAYEKEMSYQYAIGVLYYGFSVKTAIFTVTPNSIEVLLNTISPGFTFTRTNNGIKIATTGGRWGCEIALLELSRFV